MRAVIRQRYGLYLSLLAAALGGQSGCARDGATVASDMAEVAWTAASQMAPPPSDAYRGLQNPTAYIPWQCYVRTEDEDGRVHNSCYSCHGAPQRPNVMADHELQLAYDFPEPALKNRWTNLFADRREAVAAISDEAMAAYVRQDNYREGDIIKLTALLMHPPQGWDVNGDGAWEGYIPDAYFSFDEHGFDRSPEGELTGWRAYTFYPLPGAFLPTNSGSFGDVLVRLPEPFRQDEEGTFDERVAIVNFAVVEAMMKRADVPIESVDEALFGVDLDRDGSLGQADEVAFAWAPRRGLTMSYVGKARLLQQQGSVEMAAGLMPRGSELLHSLRYMLVQDGQVKPAPRMKELRYARKGSWHSYAQLMQRGAAEEREKRAFPDRLKQVHGDAERGLSNGQGWIYQGFIEDAAGELRPQSYEETVFCIGCHGGLSTTMDGLFSFNRKLGGETHQRGWYHFSQRGMQGVPEPRGRDGAYAYSFYLRHNGAIDPKRGAHETTERWLKDGTLRADGAAQLHQDVSALLLPSPARALVLGKAYRVIVQEQSFARGRAATLVPAQQLLHEVSAGQPTGIERAVVSPLSAAGLVAVGD